MDARFLFGKATKFRYRTADSKSGSGLLTSIYYALPSRIYRRFSRQSKTTSSLVQAHVTPSSSPHLDTSKKSPHLENAQTGH
jgi:hypothetical protein